MPRKKLSDRIWETRKIRIYSEERLNRYGKVLEFALIIYGICLTGVSIWVIYKPNPLLNVIQVIVSVAVLSMSIFVSAQKFGERALQMRNHYLNLANIEIEARKHESLEDEDELREIEVKYNSLLSSIENHNKQDFLEFRYSRRNDQNTTLQKLIWLEKANRWRLIVRDCIYFFVIVFLPIIVLIFLFIF